ncbi:MAG: hypothetical protein KJ593_04365 [Candidatus Omnitrophica bacterium]|nr:hypothetical protein [Candidatus Omnitrophota bacterium]
MSLLTNRLNEGIPRNNRNRRALKISCVISFCWHICLFSVVDITFPDIKVPAVNKEVMFLGSYLADYDFFPSEDKNIHKNIYFDTAVKNALGQDLEGYPKLEIFLEKPEKYFLAQKSQREEVYYRSQLDTLPSEILLYSGLPKKDLEFFDSKRLPAMNIYFKEGIPRPVKFKLYISERGRVRLSEKTISSGSFDADMFIQRALRRLVFDTCAFGRANWHELELDLKNDTN